MSITKELFFNITPPANVALTPNAVQSVVTGAAAGTSLFAAMADADRPHGKVFDCFEATGNDVYGRFGPITSAATTAANGLIVVAGQPGRVFYIVPGKHDFVDAFSTGAGVLKWQVCSPIGERIRA